MSAWGGRWGNRWGGRWGAIGAVIPVVTSYQDPGFWTEEHRKIKEREERGPEEVGAPVTPLAAIPAIIAPPKYSDEDEIEELIEMLSMIEEAERASL
jgi:hypothetical protein